jgi:hypothetical protein
MRPQLVRAAVPAGQKQKRVLSATYPLLIHNIRGGKEEATAKVCDRPDGRSLGSDSLVLTMSEA